MSSTKHGTPVTAGSEKPGNLHFGIKLHFHSPGEILYGPSDIMSNLKKREDELMRENEKL